MIIIVIATITIITFNEPKPKQAHLRESENMLCFSVLVAGNT